MALVCSVARLRDARATRAVLPARRIPPRLVLPLRRLCAAPHRDCSQHIEAECNEDDTLTGSKLVGRILGAGVTTQPPVMASAAESVQAISSIKDNADRKEQMALQVRSREMRRRVSRALLATGGVCRGEHAVCLRRRWLRSVWFVRSPEVTSYPQVSEPRQREAQRAPHAVHGPHATHRRPGRSVAGSRRSEDRTHLGAQGGVD